MFRFARLALLLTSKIAMYRYVARTNNNSKNYLKVENGFFITVEYLIFLTTFNILRLYRFDIVELEI